MKNPHPLLPVRVRIVLSLLNEELKAAHFFNGLANLGLDDCYFRPHLTFAVLSLIGFSDLPDELVNFYIRVLDEHAEKVEDDREQLSGLALSMYSSLLTELKKREPGALA